MAKQQKRSCFEKFIEDCTPENQERIHDFFKDFHEHCLLNRRAAKLLCEDFQKAILYYAGNGVPLEDALDRLHVQRLGGFYARPAVLWFPLDDAAKIYPLSMKHGKMSVFRLAVTLKEPVVPELLQMALNFTIRRFPTFATTLKKGFFWHYLDTNKGRFSVEPERTIPCAPIQVSRSGSQAFRVMYYENRISVEFFHVLTDGTGGMTFLKTLTGVYLGLTGADISPDDDLWSVDDTPTVEEFENSFARVERSDSASGFADRPALQMSGRLSPVRPCRVVHLKMNAQELKAAADGRGTTVTAYLLSLMFLAGKASTDDLTGDISIQVPVNMRKFYPSRTVRNFSMYCGIRIPIEEVKNMEALIPQISSQLREKASQTAMTQMLTATEKLVDGLKWVPLAVKQPAAGLVYGFLGDQVFTNTLSNLGVVHVPAGMEAYIDSMDFVLGTAVINRASCSLVTVNDVANFTVVKMTRDPTFEETMYGLLEKDGIHVSPEGSGWYES